MSILPLSKDPQPDETEFNAFFPSKFSLSQFTSAKSDLEDADYPKPYTGTGRILVIGTDERYLPATTQLKRWYQCTICIRQVRIRYSDRFRQSGEI